MKMDKLYRRKILDLIRTDFITMNGGKNNMRTIFIITLLIFGVLGFIFNPVMGIYVPVIVGLLFVPMLFQNELKYHSEKMFAILPIDRKDLVRSRFIMSVILYLAVFVLFYLLMLLSLKLKLFYLFFGEDAEVMNIIGLLAQRSGGSMTELGVFNLLYFGVFSFGLMCISGNLRKYFKDSKAFNAALTGKMRKGDKKEVILAFALIMFMVLAVTDILPIGSALAPVMQLLLQLAKAVNGFLLGAVLVAMSVFSTIYKYICTILEYDEKEL